MEGLPLPAVTLTFDLLIWKPNQYVSWHRYTRDKILVKLARPTIVTKILYSVFTQFFGSLSAVTLIFDLWPFDPQNRISTSMNPSKYVTKMGEILFNGFWDVVFTRFLGHTDSLTDLQTGSLTHGRTHPTTECLSANCWKLYHLCTSNAANKMPFEKVTNLC